MAAQPDSVRAPFVSAGVDVGTVHYFGQSVLLPQFRGQGIGHRFFDERESAASDAGAACADFCSVVQGKNDARRPMHTRDLGDFWRKRGYSVTTPYDTRLSWKELGQKDESDHIMSFWLKKF